MVLKQKNIYAAFLDDSEGFRIEAIASLFGVCYESIRRAVSGEQWKDVASGPEDA